MEPAIYGHINKMENRQTNTLCGTFFSLTSMKYLLI